MADDVSCALCASADVGGQIIFREEGRQPERPWVHLRLLREASMCVHCFEWAGGLIQRIVTHDPASQAMLGVPSSSSVRPQDAAACDYCRASLADKSFSVELVPTRLEFVRRSLYRHVGRIKQNRVCRQCHTWWLTTIEDSSSLKGTSFRALEGASGGWRGDLAYDSYSVFVSAQDQFVLRTTVEAMGRDYAAVRAMDVPRLADIGPATVFVGAGRRSRAADLVGATSSSTGQRTVVVAQDDSLVDGFAALRAGAVDMLASPLSPQQVSGAFERIAHPVPGLARDPKTGLTLFTGPIADDYLNCYFLEIDDHRMAAATIYLLLRRFLRGYDRLGLSPSGKVAALLYCDDRHIDNVTRRLKFIMGESVEVRIVGHAAATRPVPRVA